MRGGISAFQVRNSVPTVTYALAERADGVILALRPVSYTPAEVVQLVDASGRGGRAVAACMLGICKPPIG